MQAELVSVAGIYRNFEQDLPEHLHKNPYKYHCKTTDWLSAQSTPNKHQYLKGNIVSKIIVVTSGKGGVGKTTTSASIATGLALRGHKTAVIDFDVGLRNLDLIMGCERRVVYDLINVIHGEATLNQALIKDKNCENLYILPASQTRDKDALTREGVDNVMKELASKKWASNSSSATPLPASNKVH